jgi:RNA polymerase sigma-70 factor (ECF subfamily)
MKKEIKPISEATQKEIARLYKDYKDMVFIHVRRIVKNLHDSEDVTTEVFNKIMRLGLVFDPERGANEATWIHTITNSVIMDFFRTNHQNHYISVSDFSPEDNLFMESPFQFKSPAKADAEILTAELQDKIVRAFHGLKFKYRRVATLYFIRGYEYSEISDMLNVPMGTVKGMINRSRAKLQDALEGVYTLRKSNVQTATA